MSKILIVTDSEAGWDCLIGAYTDLERLKKHFEVPDELNTINDVQESIRKYALYVIHEIELK